MIVRGMPPSLQQQDGDDGDDDLEAVSLHRGPAPQGGGQQLGLHLEMDMILCYMLSCYEIKMLKSRQNTSLYDNNVVSDVATWSWSPLAWPGPWWCLHRMSHFWCGCSTGHSAPTAPCLANRDSNEDSRRFPNHWEDPIRGHDVKLGHQHKDHNIHH